MKFHFKEFPLKMFVLIFSRALPIKIVKCTLLKILIDPLHRQPGRTYKKRANIMSLRDTSALNLGILQGSKQAKMFHVWMYGLDLFRFWGYSWQNLTFLITSRLLYHFWLASLRDISTTRHFNGKTKTKITAKIQVIWFTFKSMPCVLYMCCTMIHSRTCITTFLVYV